MRTALLLALALLVLSGTPSYAASNLQDENLIAPLPNGFKVGSAKDMGDMTMNEFVPKAETVDNWSQMVTIQIFHGVQNGDPAIYGERMKKMWETACTGGDARSVKDLTENGYPVSIWQFTCPLNPRTKKPENMWLKMISGHDSFYLAQYAYRQELTKEIIPPAMHYLGQVEACDTRLSDRPCPKGM